MYKGCRRVRFLLAPAPSRPNYKKFDEISVGMRSLDTKTEAFLVGSPNKPIKPAKHSTKGKAPAGGTSGGMGAGAFPETGND
jgi:hypothetical protein